MDKYYTWVTATHESYGATLHIAKDIRYAEAMGRDGHAIEVGSVQPSDVKAFAIAAKMFGGLHVCWCDQS